MTDTVLDVRNLQIQFISDRRTTTAVDGISFQLQRGETLGIVGESGSGKSVTSLALMGLLPLPGRVVAGEIWFTPSASDAPQNLIALPEAERRLYRGGRIATVFQDPMCSLNPVYTIGFQLTEAIRQHQQASPADARRKAILALQEVRVLPSDELLRAEQVADTAAAGQPELDDRDLSQAVNERKRAILKRYPHELSGGQQQRVMIAMAIACNPTLLIADEPTTALDVTVQAAILALLRELARARQMSLIFITHDLGVIAEIADRIAVMYRGQIVECGDRTQIFHQPQHPYTKGLLACRPRLDQELTRLPTIDDFMTVASNGTGELALGEKEPQSLELTVHPAPPAPTTSEPLLAVHDLRVGFPVSGFFGRTKRYFMAVNGVSFQVYPGETLGLVGESGCGKSTLARALLCLQPSLHGEIVFDGQDLRRLSTRQLRRWRRQMQIVFQNPYNSLDPRQSVGRAIAEPLAIHRTLKSERQRRERVDYLLNRVGVDPNAYKRFPHEFSGGQRQRICIARALALNPRFIICDESVSALDVSVQAQVLNLLKELQAEFQLTYIFISHDLSVVKFMSDRIMVMNAGNIEEIGLASEIYTNPQTEYTRQLIASIPAAELQAV
ncbi:MAG: ABC transporter ATP-binding protein [Spirulinaceae cyanobacterium SM2_1_0]|nr:ABC transporter ATP-binding protein [Spirulinaceae cyanobacterium SM2_1_0]